MNRGGHLLKSFKLDSSSTNITSTGVTLDASGVGGTSGGGGAALLAFNSGSQPLALYAGPTTGAGGQICSIPPSGQAVYIMCIVPSGPLSLKSQGSTQSSGVVIVDVYG